MALTPEELALRNRLLAYPLRPASEQSTPVHVALVRRHAFALRLDPSLPRMPMAVRVLADPDTLQLCVTILRVLKEKLVLEDDAMTTRVQHVHECTSKAVEPCEQHDKCMLVKEFVQHVLSCADPRQCRECGAIALS